jgi:hypothetical protein
VLRTSKPDPTALPSDDTELVAGATAVVEATTTEAAIADVHDRFGPDARILDARRVLRGGIGGFFAREVVQLHAAPAGPGPAGAVPAPAGARRSRVADPSEGIAPTTWTPPTLADAAPADGSSGEASPVDRLLAGAGDAPEEEDFATFLQRQLGAAPADHGRVVEPDEPSGSDAPSVSDPELDRPTTGAQPSDATSRLWQAVAEARTRLGLEPADDQDTLVPTPAVGPTASTATSPSSEATSALPVPPVAATSALPVPPVAATSALPVSPAAATSAVPVPPAAATSALPTPAATSDASAATGAGEHGPRDDEPAWSTTVLLLLGLPADLVRSVAPPEPADDLTWTMALAAALRPLCRPLPAGADVLVGPAARELGRATGRTSASSQTWRAAVGADRWTHLVVGGEDWRRHLTEDTLAVSWATPGDLPEAIRCAVDLGLVLGVGPLGGEVRRARPLDLAVAVRDLVEQR